MPICRRGGFCLYYLALFAADAQPRGHLLEVGQPALVGHPRAALGQHVAEQTRHILTAVRQLPGTRQILLALDDRRNVCGLPTALK